MEDGDAGTFKSWITDPEVQGWVRRLVVSASRTDVSFSAKNDPPGLMAPRVTRYIPSVNCGIVTPQKNAATILFFNVRAYILRVG